FASVAAAVKSTPIDDVILDGEVVVLRPDGSSSFQALQNQMRSPRQTGLRYFIFDIPFCSGYDLRKTPMIERKELLKELIDRGGGGVVKYSDHVLGNGSKFFRDVCGKTALEGIISKRAESQYASARTRDWLKVKCVQRQEFVIGGFTDP